MSRVLDPRRPVVHRRDLEVRLLTAARTNIIVRLATVTLSCIASLAVVGHATTTPQPDGPRGPFALVHSTGGDALAKWTQTQVGGGAACSGGTEGTVSASNGDLLLHVNGKAGNCAQVSSPWTVSYGFVEARIFIPASVAANKSDWPAFWANVNSDSYAWPTAGEIDVYEQLHKDAACSTYHYGSSGDPLQASIRPCPVITGGRWYTFGAWYQKGKITFYLNGKVTAVLSGSYIVPPVSVGHTLMVEDKAFATTAPSTIKVQYIRYWTPR